MWRRGGAAAVVQTATLQHAACCRASALRTTCHPNLRRTAVTPVTGFGCCVHPSEFFWRCETVPFRARPILTVHTNLTTNRTPNHTPKRNEPFFRFSLQRAKRGSLVSLVSRSAPHSLRPHHSHHPQDPPGTPGPDRAEFYCTVSIRIQPTVGCRLVYQVY